MEGHLWLEDSWKVFHSENVFRSIIPRMSYQEFLSDKGLWNVFNSQKVFERFSVYRRSVKEILPIKKLVEGFTFIEEGFRKVLHGEKICDISPIHKRPLKGLSSIEGLSSPDACEKYSIHRKPVEGLQFIQDLWKVFYPEKTCER